MKCVLLFMCFGVGYCGDLKSAAKFSTPLPTIYIMIHVDGTITKKLSAYCRQQLKTRTQKLIKQAEKFFRHQSLDQKIRLEWIDTQFLENNTKKVTMSENATEYLQSYCEWQGGKKNYGPRYFSVMITGLDIYLNIKNKKDRACTGRGYLGGICSVNKSCAIIEWNPRNIAYLLAHEIAHSLGVPHDGRPYNPCKRYGFVMTAAYNPKSHPNTWSTCSSKHLKWNLENNAPWCLQPNYKIP